MQIAELIKTARSRTGKPAPESDDELVVWLESQEICDASDFFGLSDAGFTMVEKAPGATVVLLESLRNMCIEATEPKPRLSPGSERLLTRAPLVEVQVHGHIGSIIMDHQAKRNALSHALCQGILKGLDQCCAAGARVIVLRAQPGVSVWSAGHDIREFKREDGSDADSPTSSMHSFVEPLSCSDPFVQLLDKIRRLSVPVIGCVEGSVWGAACDVCACCDVLIGTPSVTFAITPAKIGLPYNSSGMSHFLGVLPLHVTKWMFFSGLPITADEALRYGFLNAVVQASELTDKVTSMATTISSRAPLVVSLLKKQFTALSATTKLAPEEFEEIHERRRAAWKSSDMEEGVRAFFEKRTPCFKGL